MPSEQFERKLRAKLEQAQVPPRPELWDAIAQQLADQPPVRRPIFWIWIDGLMGIVVLLLLSYGYAIPMKTPSLPASSMIVQQDETSSVPGATVQINPHSMDDTDQDDVANQEPSQVVSQFGNGLSSQPLPQATHSQASYSSVHRRDLSTSVARNSLQNGAYPPAMNASSEVVDSGSQAGGGDPLNVVHPLSLHKNEGNSSWTLSRLSVAERSLDQMSVSTPAIFDKLDAPVMRRWIFSLAIRAQRAPGKGGLFPFSGSSDPDIRTNYSRGLGGNQQIIEDIYDLRFARNGVSAHAGLAYRLTSRIAVESGLGISHFRGGKYEVGTIGDEIPIGPVQPEPFIEYEDPYFFNQTLIEFPLQLNMALSQGRHPWLLSTGIAMNYQLRWNVRQSGNDRLLNDERSIQSPGGSLVLGQRNWYPHILGKLMYQHSLGETTALSVGPSFQYQLGGSYRGAQSIGQARYRIGLELGLSLQR
ncbi:MAG: hypothetical protein AAF587_38050 [Bacteroidota bacterium]